MGVVSLNSYVFKLADFGTARQLQPDEHFTSLHGTEEYLVSKLMSVYELYIHSIFLVTWSHVM